MNFLHGYSMSCSLFFQVFGPISHFALRNPTELFWQVLIRAMCRCRELRHGNNMGFYLRPPLTMRRSFFACAITRRGGREMTWHWMTSHFGPVVQRSRRIYKTVPLILLTCVKET